MTEGGNHGGGSDDETVAALFANFSPGCGSSVGGKSTEGLGEELGGEESILSFSKVNQIDLVPTISMLLGVPIPFANLGSVIISLMPEMKQGKGKEHTHTQQLAVMLALNSAQVNRYLHTYSKIAHLPKSELAEMDKKLKEAIAKFEEALQGGSSSGDSLAYREACALFKVFLAGVTDLGRRVWTNFDFVPITIGLLLLLGSLVPLVILVLSMLLKRTAATTTASIEGFVAATAMIFHSVLLVMSNSYIEYERQYCQFSLVLLTSIIAIRNKTITPLSIPLLSRLHDYVDGHGQDAGLQKFVEHKIPVFVFFLAMVLFLRWRCVFKTSAKNTNAKSMVFLVEAILYVCLGVSWTQKTLGLDGHAGSFITLSIATFLVILPSRTNTSSQRMFQLVLIVMTLTGPSSAPSALLVITQFDLIAASAPIANSNLVLAALFKFATRHAFFATGHACSFNMLQYSAAFVWRDDFTYVGERDEASGVS